MIKCFQMRGGTNEEKCRQNICNRASEIPSFFVLFTLISVSSYKLFMHFYGIEDNDVIAAIPSDNKHAIITEPQIDVVSKHLIYCVDEETEI